MVMNNPYDVYVIDPPWPKKKGGLRATRPNQERTLDYTTLSVPEIFALLKTLLPQNPERQHTVFLWSIDQFLLAGEQQMLSLGYRQHARLIWDKQNGVAPAFSIRYCHEYLGWWYKPKFIPVAENARGKLSTVFSEKSREHSRKPDCVYSAIDLWYPTATKIDVFSREKRPGWDQFGDQVDFFRSK